MDTFEFLLQKAEESFEILRPLGFEIERRSLVSPDSFRGGFEIWFSKPGARLEIEYLEMQLEVRLGAVEIFGPSIHPGFGGNMFSGPHLVEHLPTISKIVRSTYDHLAHGA